MKIGTSGWILLLCLVAIVSAGCSKGEHSLFKRVLPESTGIDFSNTIFESDSLNILTSEYLYNGGGVAIGDFNNDGLQDIYFTGNMVSNKLYLNKGNFAFEDVTEQAAVTGEGKWCAGVALVDINNDGWLDIYVAATMKRDSVSRANLLYLNNGPDPDGIPRFTEAAGSYGIADTGYTTSAAFFDYDQDNDLDLYVLTNVVTAGLPNTYRKSVKDGTAENNDRLYRNNGNSSFTNVTREAGILFEGYGLGIAISDINLDGWPDLYVSNDYLSNDLLYINNRDGTFSNKITHYIKHTSYTAMGSSVTDINNDGLVDILVVDMMPEYNKRKKLMMGANNYVSYINNDQYGFQHQYVRNTLQLNQGFSPKGHPVFSEIGQLSGIYQTDWSWAPLVADFNNDGYRDIIITNGFPRDVTDHDFKMYQSGPAGMVGGSQLVDSIPVVKISNYAFQNKGDLSFSDKTQDWGINIPTFSNGAAYADLDNDGDLDIVINNINEPALVFQNELNDAKPNASRAHYLRIKPLGEAPNLAGLGVKVSVHYGGGKQQYYEQTLYQGYLSTVEAVAHFGLGKHEKVDSVQVFWPDGRYQLLRDVPANQQITMKQANAHKSLPVQTGGLSRPGSAGTLFKEVSRTYGIHFKHQEDDKIDFNIQRTLPHKYSQNGPGIAVGDVDGNGLDDFYVGGSAGKRGTLFLQSEEGTFSMAADHSVLGKVKAEEDLGVLFFDADNDGDLDLYAVSGSYEYQPGSAEYQDRLYRNNSQGQFELDLLALPKINSSGACVKAADFDRDGDLDLFVGGRVEPGAYPMAPRSYMLRNEGGRFVDVTAQVGPELEKIGMVSDALWSDFDNDGQVDLVVAGEWLPLTFFKNENGTLKNVSPSTGISHLKGWWNSLVAGDFDGDGDIDYVAGNLGLNTNYKASEEQPLKVFAKDFDSNGSVDPVLACYMKAEDGQMKLFPMHHRDDLSAQMIRTRKQFRRYGQYGVATMDQVLSNEDLQGALVLEANHFATSYVENLGSGKFRVSPLPMEAQVAPTFGMLSRDFDGDGNLDVLLVGNSYATETITGRYDASIGLFLKGNGKGGFVPQSVTKSGFFVSGDAKGMAALYGSRGKELLVVTQNQDSLRVFVSGAGRNPTNETKLIPLAPLDAWAQIEYHNGRKERREFYYGSTYLSQSSRRLPLDPGVSSVTVYDFSGRSRKLSW